MWYLIYKFYYIVNNTECDKIQIYFTKITSNKRVSAMWYLIYKVQ